MANKRIQIEFDLNTNEVKLAGEATLSLAQQVRILQRELSKTPEGTKEFELLRNKLNDTRDNFERVNAKSRELFGTLSLLPGPIGEIAGKLNGAISLFKVFSGFSLKDIGSQFKALGKDLTDILEKLGGWANSNKQVSTDINQLDTSTQQLDGSIQGLNTATGALISNQQKEQEELKKLNSDLKRNAETHGLEFKALDMVDKRRMEYIKTKLKDLDLSKATVEQKMVLVQELGAEFDANEKATKSTEKLANAKMVAAKATRLFAGALTAIGIGLFISLLTQAITSLFDFVTGTKAAEEAAKKFSDAIQEQNYWLDQNAKEIKRTGEQRIAQLKAEGASAAQIRAEELNQAEQFYNQSLKQREDAFDAYNKADKAGNLEIINSAREDYRKKNETFLQAESALKVLRFNIRAEEIKEAQDAAKETEQQREKNEQTRLTKEKERLQKKLELIDRQIQEEIDKETTNAGRLNALLEKRLATEIELEDKSLEEILFILQDHNKKVQEELDKDYEERRQKKLTQAQAEVEIEKNQAEVNTENLIQSLEKQRDIELEEANLSGKQKEAIISKYEKEFRDLRQNAREKELSDAIAASKGNFDKQISLYRQFADEVQKSENYTAAEKLRIREETNQKIEQLDQERLNNEVTKLNLSLMNSELTYSEYYNSLKILYDDELARYKKLFDDKIITEAEYNRKTKELSDARNNIRQKEFEATIATAQAIGQGLNAVASLIGENTKQGKALAVAASLINTYAAIAAQLRTAAGSPGAAIPGYAIAQAIATGLVGFAQVKKILSTQIPSTSTSGGVINTGGINVNARRAQGGMINGAGGQMSDNIMALLSDGEYVVNARSTRAFRPLLETINSAQNLPAFAAGGLVNQGTTPFKSQNETIADAVSTAFGQTPIKTYVTATEVSNQQQFERIIKSRSLI